MAFKFVIFALTLAYANAGNLIAQPAVQYSAAPAVSSSYFHQASAPVAYAKAYAAPAVHAISAAPAIAYQPAPHAVAVHAPSVGLSQQSLHRSLGGAQSISSYSKAIDSAFSTVRKYDTRITNDGLSLAPAQFAYSAPLVTKAYAAPAPLAYAAPAPVAYAAPAPVAYAAPAPVAYATRTYAAPAQVVSYNAAPIVAKTYAAPAQVVSYGAAPVVTKTYAAPAPVATYAAAAPAIVKSAVAYSPAVGVAHTTFQGYGTEYHY